MTNSKGSPRLSYSSIQHLREVPAPVQVPLSSTGWSTKPSPALSFGSSLHAALEWFYSVKTPHPPDLPSLLARLDGGLGERRLRRRVRGEPVPGACAWRCSPLSTMRNLRGLPPAGLPGGVLRAGPGGLRADRQDRPDRPPPRRHLRDNRLQDQPQAAPAGTGSPPTCNFPSTSTRPRGRSASRPSKLTFYYLLPDQRFSTRPWDEERLLRMLEELRGVARAVRLGRVRAHPQPPLPLVRLQGALPVPAPLRGGAGPGQAGGQVRRPGEAPAGPRGDDGGALGRTGGDLAGG